MQTRPLPSPLQCWRLRDHLLNVMITSQADVPIPCCTPTIDMSYDLFLFLSTRQLVESGFLEEISPNLS